MEDILVSLVKMLTRVYSQPCLEDIFSIEQKIKRGPEGPADKLKIIKIFVKKYEGIHREWNEKAVIEKLIEEIEAIIGDNLLLEVKSSKASRLQYAGGEKGGHGEKEYIKSTLEKRHNYQFEIDIIKRIGRGANAKS